MAFIGGASRGPRRGSPAAVALQLAVRMGIVNRVIANVQHRIHDRFKKRSFALNQIDLQLLAYLDFERGFFIEAGANDGIDQSNTYYFERYLQWRGLLVEPVPELAERCRHNRPHCIVESCALVPSDHDQPDIDLRYCNLMSLVKGARKSEQEELEHIKAGCEIQSVQTYELRVPARTLTAILDQHQVRNIDLFSLDVEGFELNVLQGLDFDKYKPRFMLIEANYREEIDSFLEPLYEPIAELSFHDVLYERTGN